MCGKEVKPFEVNSKSKPGSVVQVKKDTRTDRLFRNAFLDGATIYICQEDGESVEVEITHMHDTKKETEYELKQV